MFFKKIKQDFILLFILNMQSYQDLTYKDKSMHILQMTFLLRSSFYSGIPKSITKNIISYGIANVNINKVGAEHFMLK